MKCNREYLTISTGSLTAVIHVNFAWYSTESSVAVTTEAVHLVQASSLRISTISVKSWENTVMCYILPFWMWPSKTKLNRLAPLKIYICFVWIYLEKLITNNILLFTRMIQYRAVSLFLCLEVQVEPNWYLSCFSHVDIPHIWPKLYVSSHEYLQTNWINRQTILKQRL